MIEIDFFEFKFMLKLHKIPSFLNVFVRSRAHLTLSGVLFWFFLPEYMMQLTATCTAAAVTAGLFFFGLFFSLSVSVKGPYLFFLQPNENSAASARHEQPTGPHS